MKKIIAAVAALSAMISCSAFFEYDRFGGYNDTGFEYLRYNDDIVRSCIARPMILRGYVESLYELEDVKPKDGVSYVFTDNSGQKIGPLKCSISGKDTSWTYLDYNFIVNRSDNADYDWLVLRNDQDEFSRFRYEFTLKVRNIDGSGQVRASLDGFRYEDSPYHLKYWGDFLIDPVITGDNSFVKDGLLLLEFYKGGKKLDWLRTTFLSNGTTQHETSLD